MRHAGESASRIAGTLRLGREADKAGGVGSMRVLERGHLPAATDRCNHPWYVSYKFPGRRRPRVSLEKWSDTEVKTKGDAQADDRRRRFSEFWRRHGLGGRTARREQQDDRPWRREGRSR